MVKSMDSFRDCMTSFFPMNVMSLSCRLVYMCLICCLVSSDIYAQNTSVSLVGSVSSDIMTVKIKVVEVGRGIALAGLRLHCSVRCHYIYQQQSSLHTASSDTVRYLHSLTNAQGECVFSLRRLPQGNTCNVAIAVQSKLYIADTVLVTLTDDTTMTYYVRPLEYTTAGVRIMASGVSDAVGTRNAVDVSGVMLERKRGQVFADMLRDIAGVNVLQTGPSIAKPIIRGVQGQRIILSNAGVTQEGQQWGDEHAPEIDPFSVAHVQVIRGSAGVQYGIGAIGGVIRIEPASLHYDTTLYGNLALNLFSNNRQISGGGSVGNSWAYDSTQNHAWRISASGRYAGDAETPEYMLNNTGFRESNVNLQYGIQTKTSRYEFLFSRFATTLGIFSGAHIGNADDLLRAIERGQPQFVLPFSYTIRLPRQEIEHYTTTLRAQWVVEKYGVLEAQYAWQMNLRKEYDRFNFRLQDSQLVLSLVPSNNLTLHTHSLDVRFVHTPIQTAWGSLSGRVGLQAVGQQNIRGGSIFLVPSYVALTGGLYALEYLTMKNIQLSAGIRADARWNDVSSNIRRNVRDTTMLFRNITGSLGVVWDIHPTHTLLANITTAWRPPSMNELYSFDVHHGTAQFEIGDLRLQSEQALTFDCAWRWNTSSIRTDISVYHTRINDFINLYPTREFILTVRGTFPSYRYIQNDVVMSGLDANCEIDVMASHTLRLSYSMIRAWNYTAQEPLIFMPSDRAMMAWQYTLPSHTMSSWLGEAPFIQVMVRGIARQTRVPIGVDFADPPPGYVLVGLEVGGYASLSSMSLRWSLASENLLNQPYREYLNRYRLFAGDTGRNIILRCTLQW